MNILELGGIIFFTQIVVLAIIYMLGGLNATLQLGKRKYVLGEDK